MNIFSNLAQELTPTPIATSPTGTTTACTTAEPVRAVPMSEVDVSAKPDAMAQAHAKKLLENLHRRFIESVGSR